VTAYEGLFEDGVHVVMFDGMADLVSKVRQYLDDEPARRRIVRAARRLALSAHSWEHRAAFITTMAQRAVAQHPSDTPWFKPAPRPAASRLPPIGCFVEKPSLIERARKTGGVTTRRRTGNNGTRLLIEQKRPASHTGPYRHGFGIDDCERACAGYHYYAMLNGGFTTGDAHRRASCYCGRDGVLKALPQHRSPHRCASTCSLRDERPCGGPSAFSVYKLVEVTCASSTAGDAEAASCSAAKEPPTGEVLSAGRPEQEALGQSSTTRFVRGIHRLMGSRAVFTNGQAV